MATNTNLFSLPLNTDVATQTELEQASAHYEATIAFANADTTDLAAIQEVVGEATLAKGSTAVVKRALTDAATDIPYSYTAYVYDGTAWAAMDGNYDASNVIFGDDIQITYAWGKYTIPTTGSNTIPAKGKSVKDLLTTVLVDEKQPSITSYPKVSFGTTTAGSYEVGTEHEPSLTLKGTYGSYTYDGIATGVKWTSYSVTLASNSVLGDDQTAATLFANEDGTSSLPITGTFTNGASEASAVPTFTTTGKLKICDDTSVRFTVTAEHDAATKNATTNIGTITDKTIAANDPKSTRTATTGYIKGYRKWFCGFKTGSTKIDIGALTSDQVRALGNFDKHTTSIPSSISTDKMQQIIIAIPASAGKTSVSISNSVNGAPQTVRTKTLDVEGLNGYAAAAYDIFYVDNDNADSGTSTYTITVS